jgi:HSP20 family protein
MFGDLMNIEGTLWDEFERLRRDIDALLSPSSGFTSIRAVARGSFPAVNVGATPDAIQVYLFAPGIDTSTLNVSIQRNLLNVSGERRIPPPAQGKEQERYHIQERFSGDFHRVINLSDDVDPSKVNAVYRNGVLTVTVARQEQVKPRQIEVRSS